MFNIGDRENSLLALQEIKRELRSGQYAWPGGYPKFFIMADGEAVSFASIKLNFRSVAHAMSYPQYRDEQWTVVGVDINWEDGDLCCAHSGERIESAYETPSEPPVPPASVLLQILD